ncbi:MAG: hypothetical protein NTW86_06105, partial [Candidatus Sumerlaeota bacterium]|nr:hypothetical protein [Candidatus Sumerlaeota bacterium]
MIRRSDEALRFLIEHDLLYLCGTVLGYDKLSAGFHGWMCRWIAETHGRDSLLLVPRGHYKTTIAGIGETIQDILANPNIRILITSSTPTLPAKTLRAVRAQFERNELLRALYPDVIWGNPKRDAPKWTDDEIVVRRGSDFKEPTILAASAGREITGLHFDKVLCDDIVNRDWCNTRDQMDKLEEWFRMLDAILEPGRGWKRILGTRYSDADLYSRLIAELPPQSVAIRQVIENGRPIFPEEFNEEHIEKMKRDMGPYLFSCQMMNDPVASEDAVFRLEWFRYYKDGDLPAGLDWYVTVDAAFGEQREHDEAAILVHAIDSEGNRYFHRLVHGR